MRKILMLIIVGFMLIFGACTSTEIEQSTKTQTDIENVNAGSGVIETETEEYRAYIDTSENDSSENENTVEVETIVEREEGDKTDEQKQTETINNLIADGSYTEETTYESPAGTELIEINIEIENDVVKSLEIVPIEAAAASKVHIGNANEGLQELVVGKKLSEIDIPTRVSTSSLTTGAFKSTLEEMIEKY